MSFNNIFIPSVFDRADGGLTSDYGSATPNGALGVNYGGGSVDFSAYDADSIFGQIYVFEESSDSPIFDIGEQATITHKFFVDYYSMQNILIEYKRGYEITDNTSGPLGPNISRVLSVNAQPITKGGGLIWTLNMVSECMSFPGPPDEMAYEVVELNPPAEKHPRYSALTYGQRDIIRNQVIVDSVDVKQQYTSLIGQFSSSNNQWQNQQGQALELLFKKQKGEDSFYLSGYKLQYSKYYWYPQDINPGGYIEDPFSVVPYQFWADQNGNNVFANTSFYNQNLFPNIVAGISVTSPPYGLSWLRQTDTQVLNRTWWKVTNTWIGGPLGHWDNEWYNPLVQPLQTNQNQGGVTLG